MSTLKENLQQILDIKNDIKSALVAKGATVTTFDSYAAGIQSIEVAEELPETVLYIVNETSGDITNEVYEDATDESVIFSVYRDYSYTKNEVGYSYSVVEDTYNNGTVEWMDDTFNTTSLTEFENKIFNDGHVTNYTGTQLYNYILSLQKHYTITAMIDVQLSVTNTTNNYVGTGEETTDNGYCDQCGEALDENGNCTNPDCPNCPDYVAPEESEEENFEEDPDDGVISAEE